MICVAMYDEVCKTRKSLDVIIAGRALGSFLPKGRWKLLSCLRFKGNYTDLTEFRLQHFRVKGSRS